MSFPSKLKTILAATLLAATALPAHAVLERVGPVSSAPTIGGFPAWYQDTTGLTLEFCDPKSQLEVDGGWCLLTPLDVTFPEVFPTSFFDEHFYYAADAIIGTRQAGGKALLVMAVESAFSADVAPGGQITFARIRVALNPLPVTGTYRFIHPYGEQSIAGVAGERIFFTDDVGIGSPGDFTGAMTSRLGPFLVPSLTPGGLELPPTAGPGGVYLADPGRVGPVTGSTLPDFRDSNGQNRNHNIFRIEGPAGSGLGIDPVTGAPVDFLETTNFTLVGRLFSGVLPGQTDITRASYTRNATELKVDVFANALPSSPTRIPGTPKPAPVLPVLSFFDAPCAGTQDPDTGATLPPFSAPLGAVETPMLADGNNFWGQVQAPAIPSAVCVVDRSTRDVLGNPVPTFTMKPVADVVAISGATYDSVTQTLTVSASSSDSLTPPTLTLLAGAREAEFVAGQASIAPVIAPPNKVTVRSSALGSNNFQVSLVTPTGAAPAIASTPVLTATQGLAYAYRAVGSDPEGGALTFTLDSAPLGMKVVPVSPTAARIVWKPTLADARAGTRTVTVRATDPSRLFTTQTFSIAVTGVNSAPLAKNDGYVMIKGSTLFVDAPGLLRNDVDPDIGDTLLAANFSVPLIGTLAGNAAGNFSFTPPVDFTGPVTFTYQALDSQGLLSPAATATVTVRLNKPPLAVADTVSTAVNTPLLINVLANDSDPDTVLDQTNRINPASVFIPGINRPNNGGTAVVNADGSISYTPSPGFTGVEEFMYRVRDTYSTPATSKAVVVSVTVQ